MNIGKVIANITALPLGKNPSIPALIKPTLLNLKLVSIKRVISIGFTVEQLKIKVEE